MHESILHDTRTCEMGHGPYVHTSIHMRFTFDSHVWLHNITTLVIISLITRTNVHGDI